LSENHNSANMGDKRKESRNLLNKVELTQSVGGGHPSAGAEDSQNLQTQSELFRSYAEANKLYLNQTNYMIWCEYGGSQIGRLYFEGTEAEDFPKWRLIAKYKNDFPAHFTMVYVNTLPPSNKNAGSYFLLGGMGNNCLQYIDKNIVSKSPMLQEKSFFSAVCTKGGLIFTFGGYENIEKVQLKTCEFYNIDKEKWSANEEVQLNETRSQSAACLFDDHIAFVFGGYNKEVGTLSSIERVDIRLKKVTLIELKMPVPLRRFAAVKISAAKILLLGGLQRRSKESDAVYCFDID